MSERFPNVPTWALFRIAERDGWKCHIDGLGYLPKDPWEVDHDVALAKGGTKRRDRVSAEVPDGRFAL